MTVPPRPPPDKILFTPGPLTTSMSVKRAMLRDLGSRDLAFINLVRDIRMRLLELGGANDGSYTAIPMQGSGTFSLEAALGSFVPPAGKVLVCVNGAYGRRQARICEVLGISTRIIECSENVQIEPSEIGKCLTEDPSITHVIACHCETTSGIINPISAIGEVVHAAGRLLIVDAMSSFGGILVSLNSARIDYLVSSANKCIEGTPGFGFVLARLEPFLKTKGYARSLSLDLFDQYEGLESNGQFRFTPPTHALLSFHQALIELEEEGGVEKRSDRYQKNHSTLIEGMKELGFKPYLPDAVQSYIITSFHYPEHSNFDFGQFYGLLNERGFVIYPGKVGNAACFRVGTIGRIQPDDVRKLVGAVESVLAEMEVSLT